jgi:hypothetical protein
MDKCGSLTLKFQDERVFWRAPSSKHRMQSSYSQDQPPPALHRVRLPHLSQGIRHSTEMGSRYECVSLAPSRMQGAVAG